MSDDNASQASPVKIIVILVVVVLIATAWFALPVKEWIRSYSNWIQGLGLIGVVIFSTLYVVAVIALSPTWFITIAAGLTFGVWGFPIVVVSATIGATSAFIISRHLARSKVKSLASSYPLVDALDRAVSEEGWKIVGLLRLSPLVPFNLQNYFFGATAIPLGSYVLATFFGIMPGSALYVYLGMIGQVAAGGGGASVPETVLPIVGLVATAFGVFIISRKAQMVLKEKGVVARKIAAK